MIYNLIYAFNHILEGIGVYYYASSLYGHKRGKRRDILLTIGLYSLLYLIFLNKSLNMNSWSMMFLITVYFFVYNKKISLDSVFSSLVINITEEASEVIIYSQSGLFTAFATFSMDTPLRQFLCGISTYIIFYILLFLMVKLQQKYYPEKITNSLTNFVFILIIMLIRFALTAIHNLGFTTDAEAAGLGWVYTLIVSVIVLGVGLIISFMVLQKRQTDLVELRNRIQREEDTKNYNHLINEHDTEQRILIHDIKKHLRTIDMLITEKSYTDAKQHVDDLTNSPALSGGITRTNNRALDLIISRYITICKEAGISFTVNCDGIDMSPLTPDDVTALFCNLLDNSIEAAAPCTNSFVELIIKQDGTAKKHTLTLTNSCQDKPDYDLSGNLLTTKIDKLKHGFGVKSAERVVKKYNGIMDGVYSPEDKTYSTTIIMYMEDPTLCE